MKTFLCLILVAGVLACAPAATTINPTNHYAYGANIGWMECRGDTVNGAVIGEYVCSGYIYAANVGWINLGSGTPTNGIRYQNLSANDFGVNQDGLGNLRGYAWGANIGWINFEATGAPLVDLFTGKFSGYAWSANCGWISLSNAVAFVQTDVIAAGADTDGDGIADAWEMIYTNTLSAFSATSDTDQDGMSDLQEYGADTNPLDPNDTLRITSITRDSPTNNYTTLWWMSKPTRFYGVEEKTSLNPGTNWVDYGVIPVLGANNAGLNRTSTNDFYRIRAIKP